MSKKMNRQRRLAALLILVNVMAVLLVACGAENTSTPATTTSSPKATTTQASSTQATGNQTTTAAQAVKTVAPIPGGNNTGVTDTEIRIGAIGPMTGGELNNIGGILRTIGAYFNMVNEQGGIYGRKIKYIIEDGGFDPTQSLSAVKKLVEQDQVLAISGTLAIPEVQSDIINYLDQRGIPTIPFINNTPTFYDPPHKLQFGFFPPLAPEAKFAVRFATEQLNLKKLAIFYASDAIGAKTYVDQFRSEAQAKQLSGITEISYKQADTDVSSQISTLQQSGAEFVYVPDSNTQLYTLLQQMEKWPTKPKVMLTYYNNDLSIYRGMGTSAEGVYSVAFALQSDGDDLKTVQFREFMRRYAPNEPIGNFNQGAYIMAQVFVESLKRAGKDLNRETLVAAAESLINWRDSYANSITYGPLNRAAINSFYVVQYRNGKIEKVSDWYTLK